MCQTFEHTYGEPPLPITIERNDAPYFITYIAAAARGFSTSLQWLAALHCP